MNSGANFGFKKTIPHLLGVGVGFTLMIALVGLGVIKLFDSFPLSYQILKVISIIYLLYLAFKIARSKGSFEQESSSSTPFTFIQAALFQWVNPKAWTMALTSISLYAPSKSFVAVMFVAIVFGLINLPCISSWVVLGQKIQVLLTDQKRLRAFNITMALLLVMSLYPAI
jgi:threonine/homoserine/homoserine lactone efflux protein